MKSISKLFFLCVLSVWCRSSYSQSHTIQIADQQISIDFPDMQPTQNSIVFIHDDPFKVYDLSHSEGPLEIQLTDRTGKKVKKGWYELPHHSEMVVTLENDQGPYSLTVLGRKDRRAETNIGKISTHQYVWIWLWKNPVTHRSEYKFMSWNIDDQTINKEAVEAFMSRYKEELPQFSEALLKQKKIAQPYFPVVAVDVEKTEEAEEIARIAEQAAEEEEGDILI